VDSYSCVIQTNTYHYHLHIERENTSNAIFRGNPNFAILRFETHEDTKGAEGQDALNSSTHEMIQRCRCDRRRCVSRSVSTRVLSFDHCESQSVFYIWSDIQKDSCRRDSWLNSANISKTDCYFELYIFNRVDALPLEMPRYKTQGRRLANIHALQEMMFTERRDRFTCLYVDVAFLVFRLYVLLFLIWFTQ
jgi:hypothetical protein